MEDSFEFDITVSKAEFDTILAALRFYQAFYLGDQSRFGSQMEAGEAIAAIASDGGEPLDSEAVDRLCERINAEVW